MTWQDGYFAFSGAVYTVVLIPSLLNRKTEVPRRSSVPTAIMMSLSAYAYASLDMMAAATLSAIGAVPWFLIAWLRPIRSAQAEVGRAPVRLEIVRELPEEFPLEYPRYDGIGPPSSATLKLLEERPRP